MLKNIDPVLSPDLLWVLAAMGHGDDLAIVDANHPAARIAQTTTLGAPLVMPGLPADRVFQAVLSILPIDDFTDDPLRFMAVVGDETTVPDAVQAMQQVARLSGYQGRFVSLERNAFYAQASAAFGVIHTGETRLYGNILIRKGVVRP
jgi:L-fucose mutarotase